MFSGNRRSYKGVSRRLSMVAHAPNHGYWEAKSGGSKFEVSLGKFSKALSQKQSVVFLRREK
jgi:hypothetical protein